MRKAREWNRKYGSLERVEWMQERPCIFCGGVPCENAHTRTGGTGRKADATHIVPLCTQHHHRIHGLNGGWGVLTTLYRVAPDYPQQMAILTQQAWEAFQQEQA